MEIHRTESPGWLSNAYLIDDGAGTGVLIDGNGVAAPLLEIIAQRELKVPAILLTHHHADHVVLESTPGSAPGCTRTRTRRPSSRCSSTPS